MDEKRVVYAPVELPYRMSPLEEMLDIAVATVGRRLDPPHLEFQEGYSGAPPEIVVSRGCFPHRGLSPSYRKWLRVPPGALDSGYDRRKQTSQRSDKLAMPICDREVQRILTSATLLEREAVRFHDRSDPQGIDFINLPLRDPTGDILNEYYSYPDAQFLRRIGEQIGQSGQEFAEIAGNCRRWRRGLGVRLGDYAVTVLLEAATVYAFSVSDESSTS